MNRFLAGNGMILLAFSVFLLAGNKALLKVESVPSGAIVSVFDTKPGASKVEIQVVAGITPLEKKFEFGKKKKLWLVLEKRGFLPQALEVTPSSGKITALLDRGKAADGSDIKEDVIPQAGRLVLVAPEVRVIKRGFSSEGLSTEESQVAEKAVGTAAEEILKGKFNVTKLNENELASAELKSLWRDCRTAMDIVDPIRLPYLAQAPQLETSSSRVAALSLGQKKSGQYLLLITGKQNRETGGMVAGQLAVVAGGTAASYASAYSQAVNNGDSFFVYNIYLPAFSSGSSFQAILVESETGKVLWTNRGCWKPIHFNNPAEVKQVICDLLKGLF